MPLSPIRYAGGKTRAVKTLEKFIPPDVHSLVSPFFGGGSFENHLALHRNIEVSGYDLCPSLTAFWSTYLSDRDRLFSAVRDLSDAIHALGTKDAQRALYKSWQREAEESADTFTRAVHYLACNRCCFSGMTLVASVSYSNIRDKFSRAALDRLEQLHWGVPTVGHQDVFTTLERNPDAFLYLDPPYVMETKDKEGLYGVKGDLHRGFDHTRLRDALAEHKGRWVLSYLDVPEIWDLYADFSVHRESWTYFMKPSRGDGTRPQGCELVITNF